MSESNIPPNNSPTQPTDETALGGQQQKTTPFGITVILLGGAIVGAVAGLCLLGGLDIWSEKQRPDLREIIRSLRLYLVLGGGSLGSLLGIILAMIPGGSKGRENRGRR